MRWQGFAFLVSCALVSASTGCNSILGNDDGFALPRDESDGSATTGVPPASGPETQDESDGGGEDFDASDPTMELTDAGTTLDAGLTVDAGGSVQDASSSGVDAGPCKDHLVRCGAACVDLTKDPIHCGSCGNICIPPTSCKDSKCKLD